MIDDEDTLFRSSFVWTALLARSIAVILRQAAEESIHFAQNICLVRNKDVMICVRQSDDSGRGHTVFEGLRLCPSANLITRLERSTCGGVIAT